MWLVEITKFGFPLTVTLLQKGVVWAKVNRVQKRDVVSQTTSSCHIFIIILFYIYIWNKNETDLACEEKLLHVSSKPNSFYCTFY